MLTLLQLLVYLCRGLEHSQLRCRLLATALQGGPLLGFLLSSPPLLEHLTDLSRILGAV